MAEVVLHSYGGSLPGGCQAACEKSQLAACFAARCQDKMHLAIYTVEKQAYREGERQRLAKSACYKLVTLDYLGQASGMERRTSVARPWSDEENPIVVEVRIYAVPRDLAVACGLTEQKVQAILQEQVDRLAPQGLPSLPWSLQLSLLARERQLECLRHTGRPAISAKPERLSLA